jgi:hypothetical protein
VFGGRIDPSRDSATQPQGSFPSARVNLTAISAKAVRNRSASALASSSSMSRCFPTTARPRRRQRFKGTIACDRLQLRDRGPIHPGTLGCLAHRGLPTDQLHPDLVLLLRRQKPLLLPAWFSTQRASSGSNENPTMLTETTREVRHQVCITTE